MLITMPSGEYLAYQLLLRIHAYGKLELKEEKYEEWKASVCDEVFLEGGSRAERQKEVDLFVERHTSLFSQYLPDWVFGRDANWERVCFGYLTPAQKENLERYIEDIKSRYSIAVRE